MFDHIFIASAIRSAVYNKCVHLYNMQVPSAIKWQLAYANEYGRCASFRSGECLHYLLHQ